MTWANGCFLILPPHLLSQSRIHAGLLTAAWAIPECEPPTSAPLIAPVDTITTSPLQAKVRTFYLSRYNTSTTHSSQPTYTSTVFHTQKIPKSAANIHHFKATFMCPRAIAAVPSRRDSGPSHYCAATTRLGHPRKKEILTP